VGAGVGILGTWSDRGLEHALIDSLHPRRNPSGKTKRSKEFGQSDGVRVTGDKLMCGQQLRHSR